MSASTRPVTERLLELLDPRPGERVLELGTGLGELGATIGERVQPDGEVVLTDVSPGMLEAAERRLGARAGLRFQLADATATGFERTSFDGVATRFTLMLVPDLTAAFAEIRRVLRPNGRLAFAVWTTAPENPWGSTIGYTMLSLGLSEPPEPDAPGPFRLGDPDRIRSLVDEAGLELDALDTVDIAMRYASFDEYWQASSELSFMLRSTLERISPDDAARLRDGVAQALEPYLGGESLALPGRAWVARANA